MEFFNLVKVRRSIRKYQNKQIEREDLEKIIEAGLMLLTPAAVNGQSLLPFKTKNCVKQSENAMLQNLIGAN